jgi:hypothetical protein
MEECSPEINFVTILRHKNLYFRIQESRRQQNMMSLPNNKQCFIALYLLVCLGAAGLYAEEQMAPIPIQLPKPGYAGTPMNLDWTNVEPLSTKLRGAFLAPTDVTNVAKGKKVTSSEKEPLVGELKMITDGDKKQADYNSVELGPGAQHVTIDLGAMHEIYAILFWHYYQPIVYYGVVVQTADDEGFTKNVQTLFNNDRKNQLKLGAGKDLNYVENYQGRLADAKGVRGRFVRLYSMGNSSNDANNYIEVEVFGRPAK